MPAAPNRGETGGETETSLSRGVQPDPSDFREQHEDAPRSSTSARTNGQASPPGKPSLSPGARADDGERTTESSVPKAGTTAVGGARGGDMRALTIRITKRPLERVAMRAMMTKQTLSRDEGLSTAEYAVGTVAAAGLGGVLIKLLTSPEVRDLIWSVLSNAFKSMLG